MINVLVSADPRYNIDKSAIKSVVIDALLKHRIGGKVEVGVNIIGDRKMHELNRKYRGMDSTTDILSFALEDPLDTGFVAAPDLWLRLGDIVLSYPQVVEDASLDGISIDEEIKFLIDHGLKHLLCLQHD